LPAARGSAFDHKRVVRSVLANDEAPGAYDDESGLRHVL
jgi:hypothetical protein